MAQKQTKQKNLLFISWGGTDALDVGNWLKNKIFDSVPGLTTFISSQVEYGADWKRELDDALSRATHCVGILTDVSLSRPWFLYEIGKLSRLDKVPFIRLCDMPVAPHPLASFQMPSDGSKFDPIIDIAEHLVQDPLDVRRTIDHIRSLEPEWRELITPIIRSRQELAEFRQAVSEATQALTNHDLYKELMANSCMRALAGKTVADLARMFKKNATSKQADFRLDQVRYPEYLIHLQKALQCKAQAVAEVDGVEDFWALRTGMAIREHATSDSERIFVFKSPEQLKKDFEMLRNHAMEYPDRRSYSVFLMSKHDFEGESRKFGIQGVDFAVLTDPNSKHEIVAFYESRNIRFSAAPDTVQRYQKAFRSIRDKAYRFPANPNEHDRDRLLFNVFQHGRFHSDIVNIERYDAFEEDHPFYREMHECMLEEFRSRSTLSDPSPTVLEVGAGTGHFTKRLVQQPIDGLRVKALEPDSKARVFIERKLGHRSNVEILGTSAMHIEAIDEFSFVFSSFSEHHIRPEEKREYFYNLYRALKPGGSLIIGDEFLPPHDHEDMAAYEKALGEYHEFIIAEARKKHHNELADLEHLAWMSGLGRTVQRVDYKITVERYKEFAANAGFKLFFERCISPLNLATTKGGISVLGFEKPRVSEASR